MSEEHLQRVQEAIGANLRRERTKRNLTQQEVAQAVGYGLQSYQKVELGFAPTSLRKLVLLADFLGVEAWQLLRKPRNEPPRPKVGRPRKKVS